MDHSIVQSKPGMTNTLQALDSKPQMEDIAWRYDMKIL